jgi:hypothetical protein
VSAIDKPQLLLFLMMLLENMMMLATAVSAQSSQAVLSQEAPKSEGIVSKWDLVAALGLIASLI